MSRGPEFDYTEHEDSWHWCDFCRHRTQGVIVETNAGISTFDCYTCDERTQWHTRPPERHYNSSWLRDARRAFDRVRRSRIGAP